jgi:ubiquinone biosynthesis monooxygenase Coq7
MSIASGTTQSIYTAYVERELRSDHAGETGAVYIYKGIIAVATLRRDIELIHLAKSHGNTEAEHLALIESILEKKYRSRLLGLWRLAGWLTGAIPALFSRSAVYATIAAVETFVERHYQQQIDHLQTNGSYDELLELLTRCQADETLHKNEAKLKISPSIPLVLKTWCSLVGTGSAAAVVLARHF